jgi:hypothetical protein
MNKSTETVDCNGKQVPVWIMSRGNKMNFDRPAYVNDEHQVPMGQMRKDECVIAPAAIYRKA